MFTSIRSWQILRVVLELLYLTGLPMRSDYWIVCEWLLWGETTWLQGIKKRFIDAESARHTVCSSHHFGSDPAAPRAVDHHFVPPHIIAPIPAVTQHTPVRPITISGTGLWHFWEEANGLREVCALMQIHAERGSNRIIPFMWCQVFILPASD